MIIFHSIMIHMHPEKKCTRKRARWEKVCSFRWSNQRFISFWLRNALLLFAHHWTAPNSIQIASLLIRFTSKENDEFIASRWYCPFLIYVYLFSVMLLCVLIPIHIYIMCLLCDAFYTNIIVWFFYLLPSWWIFIKTEPSFILTQFTTMP